MTELNALIVDDEPLAHDVVLAYCDNIPFIQVKHQCYSATQALAWLKQHKVDVLFLDINMPMLSGLDLLKVLKNKPQVIITSAYQEYALESFELSVTDYLLKPFAFERFLKACNQVLEQHLLRHTAEQAKQTAVSEPKTLFIKFDKQQVNVRLDQISCLEAYGNYVKVWQHGKSQLTARTLTSFEQQLPEEEFIRVHKSTIVNLAQIQAFEGNTITLQDGKTVAIGKSYKARVQAELNRYTNLLSSGLNKG